MITEFALIAAPFFLLLGGIVEMAFMMLASNALQSAVQITGQDMKNGVVAVDAGSFRSAVCERLPAIMSCEDGLVIDVKTVADWHNFNEGFSIVESFPAVTSSDDLFIRVSYEWPIIFPSALLGLDIHGKKGSFLLAATAVIRS